MASVSIQKIGKTDPSCKTDVLVIHGMLSSGYQLQDLANSLIKRKCYRNVYCLTISDIRYLWVPKVQTRTVTEQVVIPSVERWLSSGKLSSTFDIIGHSNGGYVAIHLLNLLDKGTIRNIFTVSTPRGVYEFQVTRSKDQKVVHFVGEEDRITNILPLDEGNPTASRWIFTFPDECHCSLHADADTNGLADIIAFILGTKSNQAFVDNNGVIHIWDYCRSDFPGAKYFVANDKSKRGYTVCDGIHEEGVTLEGRGLPRKLWPFFLDIRAMHNYQAVMRNLERIEARVNTSLTRARWIQDTLFDELSELNDEKKRIAKVTQILHGNIAARHARILQQLHHEHMDSNHLMNHAVELSKKQPLEYTDIQAINLLMASAIANYRSFNSIVQHETTKYLN